MNVKLDALKKGLEHEPTQREKVLFGFIILASMFMFIRSCVVPSVQGSQTTRLQIQQNFEQAKVLELRIQQLDLGVKPDTNRGLASLLERKSVIGLSEPSEAVHYFSDALMLKGLKLNDFNMMETSQYQKWMVQKVKLGLSGSYTGVQKYISALSHLPVVFVIEAFTIVPSEKESSRVLAEIEGRIYAMQSK
jgi:Tfp pilus assembly protein PilO